MKTMALSYLDEFNPEEYGKSTFPERSGKLDNNSVRINSSSY
jgi:hypothetical protein